ncbi:MAG TPA: SRPBCC family protein [Gammaproteobacteria bacterium]
MFSEPPVEVRVTRHFNAPPERVFDAWLDPVMLRRWMFGPEVRDEEVVRLTLDARVGGRFSFVVRRDEEIIDHVGEYLEIARPRRLVFTWGIAGVSVDESRVVIEMKPTDAGCEFVLTHELDPDWADYADRTQAGWTHMLEALAKIV